MEMNRVQIGARLAKAVVALKDRLGDDVDMLFASQGDVLELVGQYNDSYSFKFLFPTFRYDGSTFEVSGDKANKEVRLTDPSFDEMADAIKKQFKALSEEGKTNE